MDFDSGEVQRDLPSKLHRTFYQLLDPAAKVNDEYLIHLLRHLTEDDDCSNPMRLNEDFFKQWLRKTIDIWMCGQTHIPRKILIFAVDLTSFFLRKEEYFIKLNSSRTLEQFIDIMRGVSDPTQCGEVKMSYLNLITSCFHHQSGLQWLMLTNYWFDIVTIASQNPLENNKSISFIMELLEVSVKQNEAFCNTAIKMIVTPLIDVALSSKLDGDVSVIQTDAMKDNLNLLNNLLEALLFRSCITRDFTVLTIFLDNFELENNLNHIIHFVEDEDTFLLLNTILNVFLYCCTARVFSMKIHLTTAQKLEKLFLITNRKAEIMFNILIRYRHYYKLFLIIEKSHLFGKYIYEDMNTGSITRNRPGIRSSADIFQDQMILFVLWPVADFTISLSSADYSDDLRQAHNSKIIKSIHSMTYKTLSRIRNIVQHFTMEDAHKGLECLQRCIHFYRPGVANTATQILIYRFSDVLLEMENFQGMNFWSQDFIRLLVETLVSLLKAFDFSWRDSVETIYVTSIAVQFLDQPFWLPKVVVKGLELLETAITKCLSPNMTFLVDDESDTQLKGIENIIVKKLSDQQWEVRYMALQVVRTVSQKAKNQFYSHQKIILHANIPMTVLSMVANDPNLEVKSKALQCLQEMIEVDEFWCYLLKIENIYDQFVEYFYLQQVDSVSKEALALLKAIYQHHKLPELIEQKIYNCMFNAALQNGYKLVKLQALSFWKLAIKKQLEYEGMIDGAFPAVTFSKVCNKIVTFNDATIKKCLLRVLHKLNQLGALYMLLHIFLTENDEEVIKTAIKSVSNFAELLIKYKVTSSSVVSANYNKSSSNDPWEPIFQEVMGEILDLETNSVITSQIIHKNVESTNHEVEFLEFVKNFELYSKSVLGRNVNSDDLDNVLNNIFI